MADVLDIVDIDGVTRRLGNVDSAQGLLRAWPVFGDTPEAPLVPRSDWPALIEALGRDHRDPHLPPTHDQNGYGACNASATCAAIESCRLAMGLPDVRLSAGDLYGRINGGRDQGSLLEDGLAVAMQSGVASTDACPYLDWKHPNSGNAAADRKRFRVLEAALCPEFEHCMSAVLRGWKLITGVMWFPNYKPDANGWLPKGSGRAGGHAIFGYKPAMRGAQFGIWHRQSWGAWAPAFDNCFVIPESAYGRSIGGFWAVRNVVSEGGDMPQPT